MKIAIMGTGGVGGLFGIRLAEAGYDVSFVARGAHLKAIQNNGLTVTSDRYGDSQLKQAKATDDPAQIGKVDYVFLTTKLWDLESSAEAIKPMIGDSTAVISLQNGVEKDEVLRNILGADHIAGGVSYVAATIKEPGVIEQRGDAQKLIFGEYGGKRSDRLIALQKACEASKLVAEIPDNIEISIWEKFVFLVAMSSVLSAVRQTVGPVRDNPKSKALFIEVMREVLAVGKARGIALDDSLIDRRIKYLTDIAPDVKSSMFHDLEQGNKLELPWLGGAVVDMGERLGVPTPANRALVAVLSPYVNGKLS